MLSIGTLVLTSKAQLELGAQGSYLIGTGDYSSVKQWGGGVHAKLFLGKNFAVGAIARTYPKTAYQVSSGSTHYTQKNVVTNLAATFDYLLSKNNNAIQPYIGADAGINLGNQINTYTGSGSTNVESSNKESHFLLAPKVGVNIGLGQTFGIFGQAQYNFTFGNNASQTTTVSGLPNPVTTKPLSKFYTLDAGVYIRLVGASKKG